MRKIHTVIWDFGGPIRDSRIALNNAHNKAVERMSGRKLVGEERFNADETWKVMGLPIAEGAEHATLSLLWALKVKSIKEGASFSLKKVLEVERPEIELKKVLKCYPISKNKIEKALKVWRSEFKKSLNDKTKAPLAQGTLEAMRIFHELGIKQAIATNAGQVDGREYLRLHKVPNEFIQAIVGRESFEAKKGDKIIRLTKPHPYILNAALHNLHFEEPFPKAGREGVDFDDEKTYEHLHHLRPGAVYIGDIEGDKIAADRAKMRSVLLSNGMGRKEDLNRARPDFLAENALEFALHLKQHGGSMEVRE